MCAVANAHPAGTPVLGVPMRVNWPLMVRNLWLQYILSERSVTTKGNLATEARVRRRHRLMYSK
eukprot:12728314-Heterocapsa_arctica.AAC.1